MKWSDLFVLSLQNLWRRKLRTILTIVGVMIGSCSIVIMISLGLGLNKSMEDTYARQGSLTTITINNYNYGGSNRGNQVQLNDPMLQKIEKQDHVVYTTPLIDMSADMQLITGRYVGYANITALKPDAPEFFDMQLEQGEYLGSGSASAFEFLFGADVPSNFQKKNARRWTGEAPDVDWLNDKFTLDVNTYDNNTGDVRTKSYKAKVTGILAYNNSGGSNWSTYCTIDTLKKLYRENKKAFYREPNFSNYETAWVKVDDYKNVVEVLDYIRDELKLEAYSPVDSIESAKKANQSLQLMLAGLGSIAMLVAAISIANTMLMSIYERTREIGVMKVLGCKMRNISMLFLNEAAFIGFFGGILGLGLSYGLSAILNYAFTYSNLGGYGGSMSSYIPPYLALVALVFSTLVGILSGLYPSQRAMRLSALAAIRNDV